MEGGRRRARAARRRRAEAASPARRGLRRRSSSAIPASSTCRPPDGRRGEGPIVFNPLVSLWDTWVVRPRALLVRERGGTRARAGSIAPRSAPPTCRWPIPSRAPDSSPTSPACRASASPSAWSARRSGSSIRPGAPRADFLFVGKLIPLHGLETILAAARLVPELTITVAGGGQLDSLLEARPPNVEWVPWIEYERLGDSYRAARCALGIFGTSPKAAPRHPEQGLPGDRLRHAGDHRRHAGGARAPDRRRECAARPARRPRGTRGSAEASRRGPRAPRTRIAAGGRAAPTSGARARTCSATAGARSSRELA